MNEIAITILTTTYNRGKYLNRLYESLYKQSDYSFKWMIVDDGSSDNTEQIVKKFKNNKFQIEYFKKANSGKCSSINYASNKINTKFVFIVDSDDYLIADAVKEILYYWEKFEDDNAVACMSFHRCTPSGNFISKKDKKPYIVSDHCSYRIVGHREGDRAEIIRADVLKQYPFPEYHNENFMSEGYLWNLVSVAYKTVYINKAIYICEYLEGGLSKTGRRLRIKNPLGMMDNCNSFLILDIDFYTKVKETLLFVVYGKFAKYKFKKIINSCHKRILAAFIYLPSMVVYRYWKKKFS